jgi:hypothetical protein
MRLVKAAFKAIAAVVLAMPAFSADAVSLRCDNCSDQDMLETALYAGDGSHQIYDIQGERLKYFVVQGWGWQPITFPVPESVSGYEVSVSVDEQMWFQKIAAHVKSVMHASGHDAQFNFDEFAIGYVGATAAEAISSFTLADQLYQRLLSNDFAIRDAGLLRMAQITGSGAARALISTLGLSDGAVFRVRIVFQNGSSIILSVGLESAEILRAETAEGVAIPLPGQEFFDGDWTGQDLGYLSSYLQTFFATTSGNSVGCANPEVVRIDCSYTRETGVHCINYYVCD